MDPVALLKRDHQQVKGLFEQFERSKDNPAEMKKITSRAIMELQIHDMIEKELFYPALRMGRESTEEILDEAEEEHHVMELLIAELLKMRNKDGKYVAKFTVLAESVKHHMAEEEGEMLPKAQQVLGSRFMALGDQMMARKEELMKEFGGKPRVATTRRRAGTRSRATTTRAKAGTTSRSRAASTTRGKTATTRAKTASSTTRGRAATGAKAGTSSRAKTGATRSRTAATTRAQGTRSTTSRAGTTTRARAGTATRSTTRGSTSRAPTSRSKSTGTTKAR